MGKYEELTYDLERIKWNNIAHNVISGKSFSLYIGSIDGVEPELLLVANPEKVEIEKIKQFVDMWLEEIKRKKEKTKGES